MNTKLSSFQELFKKLRTVGIIVSIIMILLGIFMFIAPVRTTTLVAYLFIIGIIIYGVFDIIAYTKSPREVRQPWSLVCGVLCVVLGIITLINDIAAIGHGGKLDAVYMLSIALCFTMVVSGIGRITTASALKKEGAENTGMLTASGVINLVCAAFFIFTPFAMTFIYEWIMGIYAIVAGVTLLAELLSDPIQSKKKSE